MHVKELLSLKGKICVVTGATQRYGKCIVEGLAEADGTVILTSRTRGRAESVAAEFRDADLDVHGMQLEQGDHESVLGLRKEVEEKFGMLDVFVNNAVSRPMHGYYDDIEKFAESMRINATGMFDVCREMTELIINRGRGAIIHISSMMGLFGPDLTNYEGSKMSSDPPADYFFHNAGLINLARYQSHVLSKHNIRANCICPGGLGEENIQDQVFWNNYTKKVMCGQRMANKDDVKGAVVFFGSEASAYITGEYLLMDGGMHV